VIAAKTSECRRARDAKRDIPVPLSPCARATTCTCRGRPAPGPRLRHFAPPPDPYDEWLDGVSDALASGLRQLRDLRPLRHFGQPLAPTPTADYPPRASRFPGGQRRIMPGPRALAQYPPLRAKKGRPAILLPCLLGAFGKSLYRSLLLIFLPQRLPMSLLI